MKKFLVIFSLLVLSITPALASNWVVISKDKKTFLDLDSITPYQGNYLYFRQNNMYSMWTKTLNNEDKEFKNAEKLTGEKIWYMKTHNLIDCSRKEIAIKSFIYYNLNEKPIHNPHTYSDQLLIWDSIIPESVGEMLYNYACSPPTTNSYNKSTNNQTHNAKTLNELKEEGYEYCINKGDYGMTPFSCAMDYISEHADSNNLFIFSKIEQECNGREPYYEYKNCVNNNIELYK